MNRPHSNERFIYEDCKTSFDAGLSDVRHTGTQRRESDAALVERPDGLSNANTRSRLEARFRLCGAFLQNFAWLDRLSKSAPHNVHRHRRDRTQLSRRENSAGLRAATGQQRSRRAQHRHFLRVRLRLAAAGFAKLPSRAQPVVPLALAAASTSTAPGTGTAGDRLLMSIGQ